MQVKWFVVIGIALMLGGGLHTGFAKDKVRVLFVAAESDAERAYQQLLEKSGVTAKIIDIVNRQLSFDVAPLVVVGADQGPLWDPINNQIHVPYTFFDQVLARVEGATTSAREQTILNAFTHALLHLFGHVVIERYGLPITTEREAAAEQFAILILLQYFRSGDQIALSAAGLYADQIGSDNGDSSVAPDFWSRHKLNRGRRSELTCMIYGSNPDRHRKLLSDSDLALENSELCVFDYDYTEQSWRQYLGK